MGRSKRAATPLAIERIVVRGLSPRFEKCERVDRTEPIDLELAAAQHQAYVAILRRNAEVISLPAEERHPDCVFVEDTVVMLDATTAVLTNPGAWSRVGEGDEVGVALRALGVRVVPMEAPASLDGGDVLRVGNRLVVGLSGRTNERGARFLSAAARELDLDTVIVRVGAGLHLKSTCSLADEGTLLVGPESALDPVMIADLGVQGVQVEARFGANVLALGGGQVIVSAASPATARLLEERGMHVHVLDVSELHKADGALTCLSVRMPAVGAWCT